MKFSCHTTRFPVVGGGGGAVVVVVVVVGSVGGVVVVVGSVGDVVVVVDVDDGAGVTGGAEVVEVEALVTGDPVVEVVGLVVAVVVLVVAVVPIVVGVVAGAVVRRVPVVGVVNEDRVVDRVDPDVLVDAAAVDAVVAPLLVVDVAVVRLVADVLTVTVRRVVALVVSDPSPDGRSATNEVRGTSGNRVVAWAVVVPDSMSDVATAVDSGRFLVVGPRVGSGSEAVPTSLFSRPGPSNPSISVS